MKLRFTPILSSIFLLAISAQLPTNSKELRISAALEPPTVDAPIPQPKIESKQLVLTDMTGGRWTYSFADEKLAVGELSVTMNSVPTPYFSMPIEISAPFDLSGSLPVDIIAVKVADNNATIASIYGTNVQDGMDSRSLYEFYQRTAHLSQLRLQKLQETGRNLYIHDVQVFLKFLESSRELGWRLNIKPSNLTRKVSSFLKARLAIERDAKVIAKARGGNLNDVKLLLSQVDFIQAVQLKNLWERIKALDKNASNFESICLHYGAFQNTLLLDTDPLLRIKWDSHPDFKLTALAVNAVTLCSTKLAEKSIRQSGTVDDEANSKIVELANPAKIEGARVGNTPLVNEAMNRQIINLKRLGIKF